MNLLHLVSWRPTGPISMIVLNRLIKSDLLLFSAYGMINDSIRGSIWSFWLLISIFFAEITIKIRVSSSHIGVMRSFENFLDLSMIEFIKSTQFVLIKTEGSWSFKMSESIILERIFISDFFSKWPIILIHVICLLFVSISFVKLSLNLFYQDRVCHFLKSIGTTAKSICGTLLILEGLVIFCDLFRSCKLPFDL